MKHQFHQSIFILFVLGYCHCSLTNLTIGILTDWNLYFAQIIELNSSNDDLILFYHHIDPIYPLQSFTFNNQFQSITLCSPNIIYNLDLRFQSQIVPWILTDDTPCRLNLMYLFNETVLLWSSRHEILRMDLSKIMMKMIYWNSTSIIGNMIYNDSIENNWIDFYISIEISMNNSSILHCRFDRQLKIFSHQTCLFLDYGYHQISTLAVDNHYLYVGDCKQKKIYILTLSSNNILLTKTNLPLNTSTVADIQSMLIYDEYLIWLTMSGYVRIYSLKTNQTRNLFWFDESLRAIRFVKSLSWSNRTSTSRTTIFTSSSSKKIDSTTIINIKHNPWKITAYITSIILAFALFLSAVLITCFVLNYHLARNDPQHLTHRLNISHSIDNRDFIPTIIQ